MPLVGTKESFFFILWEIFFSKIWGLRSPLRSLAVKLKVWHSHRIRDLLCWKCTCTVGNSWPNVYLSYIPSPLCQKHNVECATYWTHPYEAPKLFSFVFFVFGQRCALYSGPSATDISGWHQNWMNQTATTIRVVKQTHKCCSMQRDYTEAYAHPPSSFGEIRYMLWHKENNVVPCR